MEKEVSVPILPSSFISIGNHCNQFLVYLPRDTLSIYKFCPACLSPSLHLSYGYETIISVLFGTLLFLLNIYQKSFYIDLMCSFEQLNIYLTTHL